MHIRFLRSINDIDSALWNGLCQTNYPFIRHEFFYALEHSNSTTRSTGWQPYHAVVEQQDKVLAIMPLFLKEHSYGEYVFDWAWADAYHRYGRDYYPKFLNAVPFTPAQGPRWLIDETVDEAACLSFLIKAIEQEAIRIEASSFHCLFPNHHQANLLNNSPYLKRIGCQYHWLNQGYKDFDDFLSHFSSRKRKNVKKERQKVVEQEIALVTKRGHEISQQEWQDFYVFYHLTYFKRSGREGYLTDAFFPLIARLMSESIMMVQARKRGELVAAALYFEDATTLYGRYWGCKEEYDQLHFEACYYQGIDYAIAGQLERFDPGAQGEHKIQRGFTPVFTCSYHWLASQEFQQAIAQFLHRETQQIQLYQHAACERLPFKQVD
ncbi:MAG: GNAT family N-acetyltransferase [Pseudomonadota bacterium]